MIGARFRCQGRPLTITGQHDGHGPDDPPGWYYRYDGERKEHWISAGALPIRFKNLEDDMNGKPKLNIQDVLLKLNEIRKLTCPPTGEEIKTIGIDQVVQADQLLLDLQERILDDYGNTPASDRIESARTLRSELITAARNGVAEYLRGLRGAALFGASARLIDHSPNGFAIVHGDDNRIYFDTTEM